MMAIRCVFKLFMVFASFLCLSVSVYALTTAQLHESCKTAEALLSGGSSKSEDTGSFCVGYLIGYTDAFVLTKYLAEKNSAIPICMNDEGEPIRQLVRALLLRMDSGYAPDDTPRIIVLEALAKSFRCRR